MNEQHQPTDAITAAQKGLDTAQAEYEAAVKTVTTRMTPAQRASHQKHCDELAQNKRKAFLAMMKAKQA